MHFMRRICHMYKYVQFLESNKQNNNKKRISKNPIVIYFQQPLVKSENCTVKITFEPLKLYRQSFILYLLRLSVILRPLSFLLISSPDVSAFGSFVSHINTTTTTTITWIVSLINLQVGSRDLCIFLQNIKLL